MSADERELSPTPTQAEQDARRRGEKTDATHAWDGSPLQPGSLPVGTEVIPPEGILEPPPAVPTEAPSPPPPVVAAVEAKAESEVKAEAETKAAEADTTRANYKTRASRAKSEGET
jgi:hypothetical protein